MAQSHRTGRWRSVAARFANGLGIIKVGSTHYGFGEDKVRENSSNTSFRAIPCYSSANLGTWTYVNEAMTQ
jgi:hypothetical protein